MEGYMQRFHGTAARQLGLVQSPESRVQGPESRVQSPGVPRIRLLQKDLYAELTRRRRRAQIAARHLVEERRRSGRES